MQVSVENTSQLGRRLRIEVPEEQITNEVQNRLRSLSRTTRIQGFRPGKAPIKVVQKHYGSRVRKEVIGELIQSSFYEAVSKENLRPASMPNIEPEDIEQGDGLKYTATFEVFPEFTLSPFENLTIEKEICRVSDEDVDKMIETLRKQQRVLSPVDREARQEDVLVIDFKGSVDGEPFEGGEARDFQIELGSDRFIKGFEEGLIGMTAGENKKLDLVFPEDYHNKELAGKAVEFDVNVIKVNEQKLPELDDKFFAGMGVSEGGLNAFREEVRGNMARESEKASLDQVKKAVLDALYAANKIDLPESMVTNEARRMQSELIANLKQRGFKDSDIPEGNLDVFRQQAEKRVSLQLIISDIVKANDIKADPKKVREIIEGYAASFQQPNEVINWYYSNKDKLAEIEALALEDEVVSWLLSKARVTEKELTFDALMNKGQTGQM